MATISLGKITQGELGTLTFTWSFPEYITSPASVSGATITATMTDEDGATTAVSGTLTGTAATTVTWALAAGDSGTAGTFTVIFRAVVSGVTTYTLEATLEVIDNPAATAVQNSALVGVPTADAAWLTAASARVADGDDVATRDTDGTTGNLTVLDATGNAVDAGYAASQSASANTVVRRTSDGGIAAIGQFAAGVDGRSIDNSGVYGQSTNDSGVSGYAPTTGTGVTGTSASGTGGQSTSVAGTYHHRFGIKSAIERTTGVLKFVDSTAASDRAAQRTELGLGTAALAATGDFDAAGSVTNHETTYGHDNIPTDNQAATLALLDMATRGKTERVIVLGDSMAQALYPRLSAAILAARPGVTYSVIDGTIGGENTAEVSRRYTGALLAYPIAGTDSPAAGTVNLLARQPDVVRLRDNAYESSWPEYRSKIAPVTGVRFYDRGTYLGTARQQVYLARRAAGYLVLYPPILPNEGPGNNNINAGNEAAVMTTSAMVNGTIAQSEDFVRDGRYAAKVTASGTGNFALQIDGFSSGYPAQIEAWVYIPTGSSITSVGFYNATGTDVGTDSQKATSVKGSWQRLHWVWIPGGGDPTTLYLGYSGGGDMTGAVFYVDNIRTLRTWGGTAQTVILNNQRVYVEPIGAGALPTGLKAKRTYFVKTTGVTGTVELSESSGGAAITMSTAGYCYVYGDWVFSVTFSAEQEAAYRISAVPISTWHGAKTIIWTGHNPDESGTDINILLGLDSLDKSKMLILQVSQSSTQIRGTQAWNNYEWTTENLEAEFPGRVVYARDALIAAGSGTGQDLLDAGNGICPTSLRNPSDPIHINDAGAVVVTAAVMEKFNETGM